MDGEIILNRSSTHVMKLDDNEQAHPSLFLSRRKKWTQATNPISARTIGVEIGFVYKTFQQAY